ncbi:ABC transporter substrate-binding protein [Rhodoligotrophos defluvii]|uniref:ABC transporter substrate-binding protein n=1 Tax=Rhodoligotrophos defluvii TaxID=2561934 RepID=UPI0010C93FC2|nr:ABC transporter substrate-binding protein [Rhodoligotrophos defluvii]
MGKARILAAAFAALCLAAPASAADQGVTDTEILLGEVEPLSGPPGLLGIAHNIGVKLALAEANANGGINGRKLRLIAEDDGYVSSRTIQSLRKLISVDRVFALTSLSGSGQAVASISLVEQTGIPTIVSIGPVEPLYNPPRENVFVVGQSYEEGMRKLALYLAEKHPDARWGVVTQDDDYGVALREGLEKAKAEKNFNVVFESIYARGQKDFSSEIRRARDANVDVFIAGGIISENVAMVKEMETLGMKPAVGIFWPGRVSAVLNLIGPASDGLYAVDYVEPLGSEAGKAFVELAKKYLSEDEVKHINRYTMTGYAGARVLLSAIERCGDDLTWKCVNGQLAQTKDLKTGVMAPITFEQGSRFSNQPLHIMKADYANKTFVLVDD